MRLPTCPRSLHLPPNRRRATSNIALVGDAEAASATDGVCVGLIAAPGLPADLVPALVADLAHELEREFTAVAWRVVDIVDPLVKAPADADELMQAARGRLLGAGWDLAIVLTDLPLELSRRPVVAHGSAIHGVAVISVPALGPVAVRRRALQTVTRLLGGLLGEPDRAGNNAEDQKARTRRLHRRARQLSQDTRQRPGQNELQFTARVLTGNLRLLLGMVRTNRPWRLAAGLSRALTAAIAAGVFALVTPDIWQLSDAFGWVRLLGVGLVAVLATTTTLIVGAHLWEHAPTPQVRKQVALFNLATTATVTIGVLTFYAALFVLAALAAAILVVPALLADSLGHPIGVSEYLQLAWLTSSLATVGGALGAGLETDDTVREAAYSYRSQAAAP